MDVRRIPRCRGTLDAVLRAAPSKSVTHRALVAAALADGPSAILGPLDADDTRATRDALVDLGVPIRAEGGCWTVHGSGGRLRGGGELALGASGTTMRFLTAVAALGAAPSRLDGTARLRERPLGELVTALTDLGGRVCAAPGGGLPVVAGGRAPRGGTVCLAGRRSSQFASALLLIAPRLEGGLELTVEPPVVSQPYLDLTASVIEAFGARVTRPGELCWRIAAGGLVGRSYPVEGDHSASSYFLAAAAAVGGRVRVEGLSPASLQPDARLASILRELGCHVEAGPDACEVRGTGHVPPFEIDLTDAPDLAPTLAVLALFADGPCVLRGVAHLRHKESDRLALLVRNLRALGREAAAGDDRLEVGGDPSRLRGARIVTAGDHRVAMAFGVAGLRVADVEIEHPGCVAKSNPDFWRQLAELAGAAHA